MNELTAQIKQYDYYRYLCTLLMPADKNIDMAMILAFNNELARIKYNISEPMAGHIRLQWWRDAIDEIYHTMPFAHAHPLVNRLYRVVMDNNIEKSLFDGLIDSYETDMEKQPPEDLIALKNYLADVYGGVFNLQLSINSSNVGQASYHGGIVFGLADILHKIKYDLSNNIIMLPRSLLNDAGISEDDLKEGRNLTNVPNIIKILCDEAESHLKIYKSLPKNAGYIFTPLAVAKGVIKIIRKNNYDIFKINFETRRFYLQIKILLNRFFGVL